VNNYRGKVAALKSETSALILKELSEFFSSTVLMPPMTLFAKGAITHSKAKMYYQNFDGRITRAHRVVLEGWPLPKFSSPSDIGSLTEVRLLYESWKSGTTRFRRLTDAEWKVWLDKDLEGRVGEMDNSGDGNGVTVADRDSLITEEPAQNCPDDVGGAVAGAVVGTAAPPAAPAENRPDDMQAVAGAVVGAVAPAENRPDDIRTAAQHQFQLSSGLNVLPSYKYITDDSLNYRDKRYR
jgi:hypothetical protein